jgi:hypothetical protein
MIKHDYLTKVLNYDPDTGVFTWIERTSYVVKAGDVAGSMCTNGYWRIMLKRREYGAHRLAWFYMTGEWPLHHIDHKDRNPLNNRWSNLRIATLSQNQANTQCRPTNTSGRKGVTWNRRCAKWQAGIKVNGRSYHLGLFDSIDDAHDAYANAAKQFYGEYARSA